MQAKEVKDLPLHQQIKWVNATQISNINALVNHYNGHIPDIDLANAVINRLLELSV